MSQTNRSIWPHRISQTRTDRKGMVCQFSIEQKNWKKMKKATTKKSPSIIFFPIFQVWNIFFLSYYFRYCWFLFTYKHNVYIFILIVKFQIWIVYATIVHLYFSSTFIIEWNYNLQLSFYDWYIDSVISQNRKIISQSILILKLFKIVHCKKSFKLFYLLYAHNR